MNKGFSLVELAIVLAILGLLIGGILAGQSMIRGSSIQSTMTQIGAYRAAIVAFEDEYRALPGDMRNAVMYWGAQAGATTDGTDATCQALDETNPATGTETCNGDGDGLIESAVASEKFRFWQHLANAGLIEGYYSGVRASSSGNNIHEAGLNAPAAKLGSSSLYSVRGFNAISSGNGSWFPTRPVTRIAISTQANTSYPEGAVLTNEEAWNIDKKMDDGRPGLGSVVSPNNSNVSDCADSDDPNAAEYQLNLSGEECWLLFDIKF